MIRSLNVLDRYLDETEVVRIYILEGLMDNRLWRSCLDNLERRIMFPSSTDNLRNLYKPPSHGVPALPGFRRRERWNQKRERESRFSKRKVCSFDGTWYSTLPVQQVQRSIGVFRRSLEGRERNIVDTVSTSQRQTKTNSDETKRMISSPCFTFFS